ncbi:transmembrane protease [Culex quinquefasciatus]|uniref:Transmembrane protease n=1 Tax=Culex quinquefasciatus TaxID=7176 RepID=B0W6A8_CULQU|nr:CLIP domain-containing serine protease B10-like [Culex pipiens pallens]EDS36582.1 transmembrane protease [Culex quinquefasciatus]|eukprot:XP_001844242.1 transmembrane protease [Culex quinquefasciatus]
MLKVCLLLAAVGLASGAEVFRNAAFQCGIPKNPPTLLIVNGVDAKISDWPWHAAIRLHLAGGGEPEYVCGGTLISERFVVTAAHCTLNPENPNKAPRMSVQLGVNAVGSPEGKTFNVEKVHRHAGFSLEELRDDIALLELESPVEFTDFILPACLSKRTELAPGKLGAVVGWGVTENDIPSTKLKLAKLPVIDELECKRKEPELYGRVLTERVFCAGYVNGTTACNGDSGGGIVFERGDAWYLGGVVSFTKTRDGSHLCQTKTYSVFTRVTSYLDWIEKLTNTDFSQEYGIEKIVPCSTPGQPSGNCVPVQQCRDVFDALRSPLLSKDTANSLRQKVCQLRGVRRSVCCASNQIERIPIHRNAILLPQECGTSLKREPTTTAARAGVYELPWIAMIRYSKATPDHDPYCVGSLINNRYVLTSGNCLRAKERRALDSVRLGERTVNQARDCDGADCTGPPLEVKAVLPFTFHPQANKPFRNHDFALVRMENKIAFTDNIRPVCLPVREDLRNTLPNEFVLNLFENTGPQGSILELYKTRSEFSEVEECEERFEDYGYSPWVTKNMFCALAKGPNFICTPHIGAPLVAMVPQGDQVRAVQYGLSMFGPTNCTIAQTIPKVYNRVALYVDWILENIAP